LYSPSRPRPSGRRTAAGGLGTADRALLVPDSDTGAGPRNTTLVVRGLPGPRVTGGRAPWRGRILSAAKRDRVVDRLTRAVSLVGVSMPIFWLEIVAWLVFAARIGRSERPAARPVRPWYLRRGHRPFARAEPGPGRRGPP